jgi:hypothetical protein
MALLLAVLLVFAGLSVDVGAWYVRSTQVQKAADAAALAGVVWMPNFDDGTMQSARPVALAAAKQNGFDNATCSCVSVTQVAGNSRQVKVTINDPNAPQYFSRLVMGNVNVTRTATAEYVLPVPLGSPKNTFGTGNLTLPGTTTKENFWAAVNGYCAGHESGDLHLGRYESYTTATDDTQKCNNGSAQTNASDYNPNGYLYAIELPQAATQLNLEAYDPSYQSSSTSDRTLAGTETTTTTFKVYDRDNTPLDTSDNPLLATFTAVSKDSNNLNAWRSVYTWMAPAAGTYYVRVATSVTETVESRTANGFALRAWTGSGAFSTCTTDTNDSTTTQAASCPQIHGVTDMSIFANLGGSAGTACPAPNSSKTCATFYLASVASVHAGKVMNVQLFDSGEGAEKIEVLDPNGNPMSFTWTTDCTTVLPASTCSGSGTSLDVSGTGNQPVNGLQSNSKFNDRKLNLKIQLPNNYSTVYGTKTWWKIRYTVGSTPTDRTTWSVNIIGDPVHLIG